MAAGEALVSLFDHVFISSTQNIPCDIVKELQIYKESQQINQLDRDYPWCYKSNDELLTPLPSGKQRQKKSGRGLPTASFIASVITPVISTENNKPVKAQEHTLKIKSCKESETSKKALKRYLILHDAGHKHLF